MGYGSFSSVASICLREQYYRDSWRHSFGNFQWQSPGKIPEGIYGGISELIPVRILQEIPGTIAEETAGGISKAVLEKIPEIKCEGISGAISEGIP